MVNHGDATRWRRAAAGSFWKEQVHREGRKPKTRGGKKYAVGGGCRRNGERAEGGGEKGGAKGEKRPTEFAGSND